MTVCCISARNECKIASPKGSMLWDPCFGNAALDHTRGCVWLLYDCVAATWESLLKVAHEGMRTLMTDTHQLYTNNRHYHLPARIVSAPRHHLPGHHTGDGANIAPWREPLMGANWSPTICCPCGATIMLSMVDLQCDPRTVSVRLSDVEKSKPPCSQPVCISSHAYCVTPRINSVDWR